MTYSALYSFGFYLSTGASRAARASGGYLKREELPGRGRGGGITLRTPRDHRGSSEWGCEIAILGECNPNILFQTCLTFVSGFPTAELSYMAFRDQLACLWDKGMGRGVYPNDTKGAR